MRVFSAIFCYILLYRAFGAHIWLFLASAGKVSVSGFGGLSFWFFWDSDRIRVFRPQKVFQVSQDLQI